MKSVLFLASALVAGVAAQLQINTPVPGAAQCEPQLISFSGGTPPYFVSVQTNPIGTTAFKDFGQQNGPSVTWTVNAPIGQSLIFQIKDSTGATQTSAPFNIISGAGDGCLNASQSSPPPASTGSGSGGSSAPPPPPPPPSGSGSNPPPATSARSSGSPAASSSRPSQSGAPNGAVAFSAGVLPVCAAVFGAAAAAALMA